MEFLNTVRVILLTERLEHALAGSEPSSLTVLLLDLFATQGTPINVVQRFADTRISEALVAAGKGIAGLPRYTAAESYRGRIVLKPLRGGETHRHIFILMRPDRAERLAVRKIVHLILDEAQTISDD